MNQKADPNFERDIEAILKILKDFEKNGLKDTIIITKDNFSQSPNAFN